MIGGMAAVKNNIISNTHYAGNKSAHRSQGNIGKGDLFERITLSP